MVDDAITADTPSAASPAADEAQAEMLAGLTQLAFEMARAFQAQGAAALAAGDVDRAGKAVAGFNHLFLGIRRAVALKARLRRQRQEEQAADEAAQNDQDAAMLSELMELALELARGVQAEGLAAIAAGDLDRAGTAETRFSSLFLGIRRAVALKARLRTQQQEARHQAEDRRQNRQDETAGRRHAVAQGATRAIAGAPGIDTEAKEELTVDLWDRLTGDERIDTDLADRALPIEALIASLCRALGLPPSPPAFAAVAGSAAAAKAGPPAAGPKGQPPGPAPHRAASNLRRTVPADDVGGSEDDHPSTGTGPPAMAPPPDPPPPRDRRRWRRLHRLAQIQRPG
ncbi:hypothetical protein [Inquilinus sp.]|jgi:hypothetical protein|uniref:hypothetical protein n=1 Tax=Inquilinus sp. TaxID=1932117 RepID=UPI003783F4F9